MTGQLALLGDAADPPDVREHAGRPVSWGPWSTSGRCGACGSAAAVAVGVVLERRRCVPPRASGFAFAVTPEVYPVGEVRAVRCGCGTSVG